MQGHVQGQRIEALVLRAVPSRGRIWIVHVFTQELGRVTVSLIANEGAIPSPFMLIEFFLSSLRGDFGMARDMEVIDSFTAIPSASSFLPVVRVTIERCLPHLAPSKRIWDLIISLLHNSGEFEDWKAAALLFVLQFFEQEGVSPYVLTTMPQLSEGTHRQARELIESDVGIWRRSKIEKELLEAALETVNVTDAKGGT